jgi:hypothetical protein
LPESSPFGSAFNAPTIRSAKPSPKFLFQALPGFTGDRKITLFSAGNTMGVPRRPRVAFICNEETKEFLEEWAETENRSVSNLVETIVEEAVSAKKTKKSKSKKED